MGFGEESDMVSPDVPAAYSTAGLDMASVVGSHVVEDKHETTEVEADTVDKANIGAEGVAGALAILGLV